MRISLGSLLLGALLVAGGFFLACGPSLVVRAQAGVSSSTDETQWLVTNDDASPGRIYVWQTSGSELLSVTIHDCDRVEGTVTSRRVVPASKAASAGGR